MEKFMAPQALYEYQRALRIDPLNVPARLALARILLNNGYPESYLSQLQFLKDRGKSDTATNDTIESYTSLLQNSLPLQWGVQPFYLDKTRWKIGLYGMTEPFSLHHQNAVPVCAGMLSDIFNSNSSVSLVNASFSADSYAQAFRDARSKKYEFFALLSVTEGERNITLHFDLYSAASGNKLASFDVYRTGNDRLASAMQKIRDDVCTVLPQKAKIIRRRGSTVLIDFGSKDGAAPEQTFAVYKKDDVQLAGNGIALKYDEKKSVGEVKLNGVGEDISQGEFKQKGFYDLLAVGDELIPLQKIEAPPQPEDRKAKKKGAESPSVAVEKRKSVLYELIQSIR